VLPSPNDQTQEVGAFADESTNWTVSGHDPSVPVTVNDATGAEEDEVIVTYASFDTVELPILLTAVRVTV
jgi:hypothetical protein